jgi:hypothetical protein
MQYKHLKRFCDRLKQLNEEQISKIDVFVESLVGSKSSKLSQIDVFVDVCCTSSDPNTDYKTYKESASTKEKLRLRYGNDRAEEYSKIASTHSSKIVHVGTSRFGIKPWLKEGKTIEDFESFKKDCRARRDKSMIDNNTVVSRPATNDFWLRKGYSLVEADELKKPYLPQVNGKTALIEKYGEHEGAVRLERLLLNRKQTFLQKYGQTTPFINGSVSKESKQFFVPLYKILRKTGIEKSDIYWGLSREWCIQDTNKKPHFYDFTIKSKRIIIEYHGIFWHPTEDDDPNEWKNPFISYDDALKRDAYKRNLAKERGFTLFEFWNNDLPTILKVKEMIYDV